jgi:hypothetical protein
MRNSAAILVVVLCCNVAWGASIGPPIRIDVAAPTHEQPVTAAMTIVNDKGSNVVRRGELCVVWVRVRILPLFHIYGLNKSGTDNAPTRLKLAFPKGVKAVRDWTAQGEPKKTGKALLYEEEITFVTTLMVGKKSPQGKHAIKCQVEYQVCNEELCWPPAKIDLAAEVEVVASN